MTDKLSQADIYAALLNYARENETLIYSVTSTYFAIALPLAGVAMGAGGLEASIQMFAAAAGVFFSLAWFLVVERCRRWFTFIVAEAAGIERASGYPNGRSTIYDRLPAADAFIRFTPRSSRVFSLIYIVGLALFIGLTVMNAQAYGF